MSVFYVLFLHAHGIAALKCYKGHLVSVFRSSDLTVNTDMNEIIWAGVSRLLSRGVDSSHMTWTQVRLQSHI